MNEFIFATNVSSQHGTFLYLLSILRAACLFHRLTVKYSAYTFSFRRYSTSVYMHFEKHYPYYEHLYLPYVQDCSATRHKLPKYFELSAHTFFKIPLAMHMFYNVYYALII